MPEFYDDSDFYGELSPEIYGDVEYYGELSPELYGGDPTMISDAAAGALGVALLGGMFFFMMIMFAIMVIVIVSLWKVFTKAGRPGWAAIIPYYNQYKMVLIAGKPGWWFILFFVPFVNLIIMIIVTHELSKAFGKGAGYTIGLIFLPFIFWPMLAFGDAKYTTPVSDTPAPDPAPSA